MIELTDGEEVVAVGAEDGTLIANLFKYLTAYGGTNDVAWGTLVGMNLSAANLATTLALHGEDKLDGSMNAAVFDIIFGSTLGYVNGYKVDHLPRRPSPVEKETLYTRALQNAIVRRLNTLDPLALIQVGKFLNIDDIERLAAVIKLELEVGVDPEKVLRG